MPVRKLVLLAAAVLVAASVWACSGGAPLSPSTLSPSATSAPGRAFDVLPAEDDPPPPPMPEPGAPAPGAPAPAPAPGTGALPAIISIVSSFGTGAYVPNPLTAVMGDMLVWVNDDLRMHHIVLEDGRDLGQLVPGAQTAPVALTTPSTSFTCLIHPSMFGTVNRDLPPPEQDPYPEYSLPRRGQR